MTELEGLLKAFILLACVAAMADYLLQFPNPPRLTRRWLPPHLRWPVPQLWKWVEDGRPDPGFLRFFMRDPDRAIPPGPSWVSPVDGTVLDDQVLDGRRYLVISLNVWDVHVGRIPFDGTVLGYTDHGDRLETDRADPLRDEPFYFLRDKRSPKQKTMDVQAAFGLARVRFITSYLSRRIEFFHPVGTKLRKGDRMGRMLFGSTCVLEVDAALTFDVQPGQRLVAGESVIHRVEGAY